MVGMLFGVPCMARYEVKTCDKRNTHNVYMRYSYDVERRNMVLFFVPSMYTVAKGERHYEGETFGRMKLNEDGKWKIDSVVYSGNARRYDRTMPLLAEYLKPDLRGHTIFDELLLSPFNKQNRRFYRYTSLAIDGDSSKVQISFVPRIANTQLVRGSAVVDVHTERILSTTFSGEFDMLRFTVDVTPDNISGDDYKSCEISTEFRFAGNKVKARLSALYDCPDTLRQVVERNKEHEKELADSLETEAELSGEKQHTDVATATWDFVGDHLLSAKETDLSGFKVNMSPLINPLHIGYGPSKGLTYRMDAGIRYAFSSQSALSLDVQLGYSFKNRQFYYTAPLRYTFNERRHGWLELTFANGNRISDSRMLGQINGLSRDTLNFEALDLHFFDDKMAFLEGNYSLSKQVDVSLGAVYHRRTAVNKTHLEELGGVTVYESFAPMVRLTCCPFERGPVITGIYERSLKGVLGSNVEYEKYELDASYKRRLPALRRYSLRLGGGFYTNSETTYFVDYVNFHENYLLHGWDDDWEGQFQLLQSQWYNASDYYVRFNASYESPLMLLSHTPLLGRFVETERLYFSALQIEDTAPYTEMGYAFTNRYFSAGIFGGCVGVKIREIGCKFAFELFRRW